MKHSYEKLKDIFDNLGDFDKLMFQGESVSDVRVTVNEYENNKVRLVISYGHNFFDTKDWWNETEDYIVEYLNDNLSIYTYMVEVDLND